MNVPDHELLARLCAADAARPVPAGQPITPASLRSHAGRRAAGAMLVATALVTALGLPLLFRSALLVPTTQASSQSDVATELRLLRAQLAALQVRTTRQQLATAAQRGRDADDARGRAQRFELAAVRAAAVLHHREPTTTPETRR